MFLYYMWTTVNHEFAVVDFKDTQYRLFNFFVKNQGDGKFLNYATPIGIAQEGYTKETIVTTDYIHTTGNVPVFSEKFVEELGEELKDEISFYKCIIKCEDESFTFYFGKIEKYIDMIDRDKTVYKNSPDGNTIVSKLVFKNEFVQNFFVARDEEYKAYICVSEDFKRMVEQKGLCINFYRRPQ